MFCFGQRHRRRRQNVNGHIDAMSRLCATTRSRTNIHTYIYVRSMDRTGSYRNLLTEQQVRFCGHSLVLLAVGICSPIYSSIIRCHNSTETATACGLCVQIAQSASQVVLRSSAALQRDHRFFFNQLGSHVLDRLHYIQTKINNYCRDAFFFLSRCEMMM